MVSIKYWSIVLYVLLVFKLGTIAGGGSVGIRALILAEVQRPPALAELQNTRLHSINQARSFCHLLSADISDSFHCASEPAITVSPASQWLRRPASDPHGSLWGLKWPAEERWLEGKSDVGQHKRGCFKKKKTVTSKSGAHSPFPWFLLGTTSWFKRPHERKVRGGGRHNGVDSEQWN